MRGSPPHSLVVRPITDSRHPAYNPEGNSFRCVTTRDLPKNSIIGPPYAGILHPNSTTDDLEIRVVSGDEHKSNASLCLRWSYSFDAPQYKLKIVGRNVAVDGGESTSAESLVGSTKSSGNKVKKSGK